MGKGLVILGAGVFAVAAIAISSAKSSITPPPPGGCVPNWQPAGEWSECSNDGTQTRLEFDGCGNTRSAIQNCTPSPGAVGYISFHSTPQGAEIFLDNVDTGHTTPHVMAASVGPHTFIFKLADFTDKYGDVIVNEGSTVTVTSTLIAKPPPGATTGNVYFESNPSGAEVWFTPGAAEGDIILAPTGITPVTFSNVLPGTYEWKLILSGYNYESGMVTVVAGETSIISRTFTPVTGVATGTVDLMSNPSEASIFIDGVNIGQKTPYIVTELAVGTHEYTLVPLLPNDGWLSTTGSFEILAYQMIYITVNIECGREPSYTEWTRCNQLGKRYRQVNRCGQIHTETLDCVYVPYQSWSIQGDARGSGSAWNLYGTVEETVNGGLLWTIFGLPNKYISYGLVGDIPATWIDTETDKESIAVIRNEEVWLDKFLSGGNGEIGVALSQVTILSQVPGQSIRLKYPAASPCTSNWQCEVDGNGNLNGYKNNGCGLRFRSEECNPPIVYAAIDGSTPAGTVVCMYNVNCSAPGVCAGLTGTISGWDASHVRYIIAVPGTAGYLALPNDLTLGACIL